MKRENLVIILSSLLVLSCGQQQKRLKVTYLSDPPGGTLYKQNGESWGPCPKILWYDISGEAVDSGKLQAKGLIVRWPSGPEKRSDDTITFPIDGTNQEFTFIQNDGVQSDLLSPGQTDKETAAIDRVIAGHDTGLREEIDEPKLSAGRTIEAEKPVVDTVLEQADEEKPQLEREPELREEPDEDIVRIAGEAAAGNRNEGIIERPGGSEQAKIVVEPGILEEPEAAQSETVETAAPVDPAENAVPENTEPSNAAIKTIPITNVEPKEQIVQPKVQTKTVDLGNGLLMDFALIPPGEFLTTIESDGAGDDSDQKPTQQIKISRPFYIGRYEVTQEQYEKIMGVNPAHFKGPKHPVETVSWHEAQRFCEKLSSTVNGVFRLPTEAEWEYACRAGTTTTYYWGDDFDGRYARTIVDRGSGTENVGTRLPNAWGLYDMSGNAWEWCADWYGKRDPTRTFAIDPKGPSGGDFRVLRGGSWGTGTQNCRSSHRNWHTPNHRYDDCGFRIVMEVEPASR